MDAFLNDFTSEGTLSLIAGDDFRFTIESELFDDASHEVFMRIYDINEHVYLSNFTSDDMESAYVPDIEVTDKGQVIVRLSGTQTAVLYDEDNVNAPLASVSSVGNYKGYRYTIRVLWHLTDENDDAFTEEETIAYHKKLRAYKSPEA